MIHGLAHLKDQPDAKVDVLVVDLDTLCCIEGVVTNVSEWGCRVTSEHVGELYKNIGIRVGDMIKMTKAHVTSVKGNDAAVVFQKTEQAAANKRRERRNNVKIPVTLTDPEGGAQVKGTIVDAGNNGCRITAKGLMELPEKVLLKMDKVNKPVMAEFAWRNGSFGGFRLLWDEVKAAAEAAGVTTDAPDDVDEEDLPESIG